MKLSNNNAIAITNILSGMKLNKIPDKNIKSILLWNYVTLRKIARDANDDTQEIIKKFQEDWRESISPVRTLREENKPVVGFDDYLAAEKDANEAISAIMEKEIDANIRPIELEGFIDAIDDEDISFEQVALFKDYGLIK